MVRIKVKAPVLPLASGIILGAISLTMPWLVARKYQEALDQTIVVERYMYFLWGHTFSVYGKEGMTQTFTTNYIQNIFQGIDFPVISMLLIVISIVLGLVAFLGGRGTVINLRGTMIRIKPFQNPILVLTVSALLPLIAWYYLQLGAPVVRSLHTGYEIKNGPANEFMIGSFIAYALTALITLAYSRREKEKTSDD